MTAVAAIVQTERKIHEGHLGGSWFMAMTWHSATWLWSPR